MLHYISNLPLGVTNEGRDYLPSIKQFLSPLLGTQGGTSGRVSSTPSQKVISDAVVRFPSTIGELHTIFYLCFLVLLVLPEHLLRRLLPGKLLSQSLFTAFMCLNGC